jgi:hypothetical protein
MAQAWRHAVGTPLSSNVRQHTQALRCASISIQRLRMAVVGSIQSVEPFRVASVQVAAVPNTRLASNAAPTSFGVREFCRWFAYRQNPKRSCWWQSMSTQSLGSSGRPFWPLIAKLLAKKVVVAFPAWPLRVARAGCMPGRGRPNPGGGRLRFSYRSSGAPTSRRTGHQAQGLRPILRLLSSTPRCWLPLTANVRRQNALLVPPAART